MEPSGCRFRSCVGILAVLTVWLAAQDPKAREQGGPTPTWHLNATVIEACSCPMFCQCNFNSSPAIHEHHAGQPGPEQYCRFNRSLLVNRGTFGHTPLSGLKFWMAGD